MYHQETCCFLVTFVIEKTCKHKMMNEKKKTRKARRTKADIEKAINEAARSTIMEKGFAQTTILDIIKKAKIEPATFYKRYKNLEAFYNNFTHQFDYWFSDTVKHSTSGACSEERYSNILKGLLRGLGESPLMQELLRWEVSDANDITKHTAQNRELHTLPLVGGYEETFKNTSIDINAVSALLTAGIYYLTLHSPCAPFCGIDINTEEGFKRIETSLEKLTHILFNLQGWK